MIRMGVRMEEKERVVGIVVGMVIVGLKGFIYSVKKVIKK